MQPELERKEKYFCFDNFYWVPGVLYQPARLRGGGCCRMTILTHKNVQLKSDMLYYTRSILICCVIHFT